MYEVIVLGATYVGAAAAHEYGKGCLVIERRLQAGYEFSGALHICPDTDFYSSNDDIYPYFKECDTVFACELYSVEKTDSGFRCTVHGVDGFRTYECRHLIDTRCTAEMSSEKTFNLLIESASPPSDLGLPYKSTGKYDHYVISCPVHLTADYSEARRAAYSIITAFSDGQRLILSANEFDLTVKKCYPMEENGILYIPSKAYDSPKAAFEAGCAVFGKEVLQI